MKRLAEFFEGENSYLSMGRLLAFMSFFPASWVILTHPGAETLGWYVSAYVLGYIGGKGVDMLKTKEKPNAGAGS
jgi:hypothetical protein